MEKGRGVRRESPLHRLLAATCQLAPVTEMWGNYVIAALVTCLHRYPGKAIYPLVLRRAAPQSAFSFIVARICDTLPNFGLLVCTLSRYRDALSLSPLLR